MIKPRVVIFTDEPGWHGRQLQRWFDHHGLQASFVSLTACAIDLQRSPHGVLIPGFAQQLPAAAFVRGIPGGSLEEIVLRLNYLHSLTALGCVVFNTGRAIERTVDKSMTSLLLHQHGIATPRTFVSEDPARVHDYVEQALSDGRELVKKPLFGSQGEGLERLSQPTHTAALLPGEVAYLQDFVAPTDGSYRDCRVMVVKGRALAAMERSSPHWVTNRAQGAECRGIELSLALAATAEAAATAVDIDYCGVDLLQNAEGEWLVIEVNGIPAWQGLQRATGLDITATLGTALLERMAQAVARQA